jgi:hypothetical protein
MSTREIALLITVTLSGCGLPPAEEGVGTAREALGCANGVAAGNPSTAVMSSPRIVHRYWGSYWYTDYRGRRERAQQTNKWSQILNAADYYAPLAQYGVGQGAWVTPATANPQDSTLSAGVYTDTSVGDQLQADDAFDQTQLVAPLDPENTVYVIYFGPGLVPARLFPQKKDVYGNPMFYPSGDGVPDTSIVTNVLAKHLNIVRPDPYRPGQTRNYYYVILPYWSTTNQSNGSIKYTGDQLLAEGNDVYGRLAANLSDGTVDMDETHEIDEAVTDRKSGWVDSSGNEVGDKCNLQPSLYNGTTMIEQVWSNAQCGCADRQPQPAVPPAPTNCVIWPNCGGAVSAHCDNMAVDHFDLVRTWPDINPVVVARTTDTMTPPAVYLSDSSVPTDWGFVRYSVCARNILGKGNCTASALVGIDWSSCGTTGAGGGGTTTGGTTGGWHGVLMQ